MSERSTIYKYLKHKKKGSTLKYNNLSLLKGFKRFFAIDLCGLHLKVRHFDDLCFTTT